MNRIVIAVAVASTLISCRYHPTAAQEAPVEDLQGVLRTLVERNPDDVVTLYTLARFADRAGDVREATHWLRRLEATSWNRVVEVSDFRNSSSDPRFREVLRRLDARALVVRNAEDAFDVDEQDLLPEGMAYDPVVDRFLLSSGRQRKVVSVGRDGSIHDLVRPAQDGIFATLGMKLDADRRALWVASAAAPFMIDYAGDDAGRSALFQFDADTGETIGQWEVDWAPSLLNDVVVAPDGSVFATETISGAIVRRERGADALDTFLGAETFFSPNGITISEDGASLYVAHFRGISRVDVASRQVIPLGSLDSTLHLGGIDGLYRHEGRLIAIQNLIGKGRVWSIALDGDRVAHATILESGTPSFRNPTTGVVVEGAFFFMANPGFQEWDGERVTPAAEGERLRVLRLPL